MEKVEIEFWRLQNICKYRNEKINKCISGKNFAKPCDTKSCPMVKELEKKKK